MLREPQHDQRLLETLPNIDINIKTGNSLISRFALDADLKQALKKSGHSIEVYKIAVQTYRDTKDKAEKQEMQRLINAIKNNFKTEIANYTDPVKIRLSKLGEELFLLTGKGRGSYGMMLFEEAAEYDSKNTAAKKLRIEKIEQEISKLNAELEERKNNRIYDNAFEWRFEFPEVLNDDGDFIGFDVVIGNPPYGVNINSSSGNIFHENYKTFNNRGESYTLFIEKALNVLTSNGHLNFIVPDTLLSLAFTEPIRSYILKNSFVKEIDLLPSNVFADATVDTILLFSRKNASQVNFNEGDVKINIFNKRKPAFNFYFPEKAFIVSTREWYFQKSFNIQVDRNDSLILEKLNNQFPKVDEFASLFSGIKVYEVGKGSPSQTVEVRNMKPFTSKIKKDDSWYPFFDGKDIGRYQLFWKEDNYIKYGSWLAAPRIPENFQNEKILIRKITGRKLIAHYIPFTSYCNTLLFVLKLKPEHAKISYQALLGILNSEFIGWYFRKKFQISKEDTFPQIMIRDILQFPVPNVSNSITVEIGKIVNSIIEDDYIDTSLIEKEIDQLVYQLYGLTEEDIKIVEGKSNG